MAPIAVEAYPEECLLRDLLRAHDTDPASPAPVRAPSRDIDWEKFLAVIRWHGVAYAARHGLIRAGSGLVPEPVAQALDRMLLEIRGVNVLLLDRLRRLAAHLEQAGIPFLALKGPALVSLLYRDPAERPMGDLDLLIRRGDLGRALEVLQGAGLRVPQGGERRFWESSYHHIALGMGGDLPSLVELHWDLELRERYPIPLERVWAEATTFQCADRPLRTLGRVDQFVFGAIHLARHFHAPRLVWLMDQRRMARQWTLDWDEIARRAVEYRARTPLWFVSRYEERIFGDSALPAHVRPVLRPAQALLLKALEGARPLEPLRDVAPESRRIFATLLFFDRLTDLVRFLVVHAGRKLAHWSGLERLRRSRA